jgi:hypothetical protein
MIPILLLEFLLSGVGNVIMLVLIGRSYRSMTTLNVFLMSLSILNLIVTANQPILIGLIFTKKAVTGVCHFSFIVRYLGNYGITFLQLFISYNRYHATVNPIHWESNIRRAWKLVGSIWLVSALIAVWSGTLYIRGIEGDIDFCFWASFEDNSGLKIFVNILLYAIVWVCVMMTCYYYAKTIPLHNETRLAMEREMEMTADIQQHIQEHNSPEKTTKSLVMVFVIQITAVIIPLSYDIIRMIVIAISSSDTSHSGILLFLTTFGLFTTTAPFFPIIVNRRYRNNVASIFKCKCKCRNSVYLQTNDIRRASMDIRRASMARKNVASENVASMDMDRSVESPPPDFDISIMFKETRC